MFPDINAYSEEEKLYRYLHPPKLIFISKPNSVQKEGENIILHMMKGKSLKH